MAEGVGAGQILKSPLPVVQVDFSRGNPGIIVNRIRVSISRVACQRGDAAGLTLSLHFRCQRECAGSRTNAIRGEGFQIAAPTFGLVCRANRQVARRERTVDLQLGIQEGDTAEIAIAGHRRIAWFGKARGDESSRIRIEKDQTEKDQTMILPTGAVHSSILCRHGTSSLPIFN